MKLHQLSLFMENKPGQLRMPCRVLAQAGINILTLTLADTQKYGILRMIVRDWKLAKQVLERAGCVVHVSEVVALEVPDEPGGLYKVFDAMEEGGINVEYMYAFTDKRGDKSVLVFRFSDNDAALRVLAQKGITVVRTVEIHQLSGA